MEEAGRLRLASAPGAVDSDSPPRPVKLSFCSQQRLELQPSNSQWGTLNFRLPTSVGLIINAP